MKVDKMSRAQLDQFAAKLGIQNPVLYNRRELAEAVKSRYRQVKGHARRKGDK